VVAADGTNTVARAGDCSMVPAQHSHSESPASSRAIDRCAIRHRFRFDVQQAPLQLKTLREALPNATNPLIK
jgi:hypothetical protein